MNSEQLAAVIAGHADDKKAQEIVELDLRGVIDYTDYFVVCSGGTERQVKAIADGIHIGCKTELGILPRRVEGLPGAQWVLMDYLDVVVHVFVPRAARVLRARASLGRGARAPDRRPVAGRPAPRLAAAGAGD